MDVLSKHLFLLLVRVFAPTGVIELSVDDTLARKRGLMVYGTGMHHDPLMSSRAKTITSWGHDWVILCLVLRLPARAPTKAFSLPFCFRLYRNRQGLTKGKKKTPKLDAKQRKKLARQRKQQRARNEGNTPHRTRPELAVEILQIVASWLPDREFVVTGDSAYGGASVLQKLPTNIDLISHVHPKGCLYEPAPKPQLGEKNGRGRQRKKGLRLPGMVEWAKDATKWRTLKFDEYGFHATVRVKVIKALYYKAGKDRLLTIVLVQDTFGKRPDQMFYCTCLDWDARRILSCYARRWSIEVAFHDCKQLLGFEDPAMQHLMACSYLQDDQCQVANRMAGTTGCSPHPQACEACATTDPPRAENAVTASLAIAAARKVGPDTFRSAFRQWSHLLRKRSASPASYDLDTAAPTGPGSRFHRLLREHGLRADCVTTGLARTMNERGADWCRDNVDLLVTSLADGLRPLLRLAIRHPSEQEKLILKSDLCPGDLLTLTAAVESLHRTYPGQYLTDVRTPVPEIWLHNPHVTPVADDDRGARVLQMHYSSIHRCNQEPVTFLAGYTEELARHIGRPLTCRVNRPCLYLSDEETQWIDQVAEHVTSGRKVPFWLVNAGIKRDYTAKAWPVEYYQEVVRRTTGKIQWVQVGAAEHDHPRLDGVIDLRGQTDHRQLIRLAWHCQGGLGPVTYPQHLCAAWQKPYICLLGGREPVSWVLYPLQHTLHTLGTLECCKTEACWKSRVQPLATVRTPTSGCAVGRCSGWLVRYLVVWRPFGRNRFWRSWRSSRESPSRTL